MNALLRALSVAVVVSAAVACSPHVIGGDGGSGAGASGTGASSTGGSTTACDGSSYEYCQGGVTVEACCPAAAHCPSPPEFCDLGDGTCYLGPCSVDADAGSACAEGSIYAASYDQSCTSDTDCAAVYSGSLCTDCFCPNAAINQKDFAAYQAIVTAAEPPTGGCFCPIVGVPICVGGTCALVGGM